MSALAAKKWADGTVCGSVCIVLYAKFYGSQKKIDTVKKGSKF